MKMNLILVAMVTLGMSSVAGANSYSALANDPNLPTPTGGVAPLENRGSLTVFTDEASFLSAAPGVVTEGFETNLVVDNSVATCTEPVNSSSNDICFAPGNLLDGFSITSSSGGGVVILTTGFFGVPSDVMGANGFGDTTLVDFGPAVTALGMTVYAGTAPGDVQITYFDGGGATIGTVVAPAVGALPANAYIGVTSPTPIASIEVNSMVDNGELIDNLSYGNAGPPPIIPTLGMGGLILLALGLFAVAVVAMRRRAHA